MTEQQVGQAHSYIKKGDKEKSGEPPSVTPHKASPGATMASVNGSDRFIHRSAWKLISRKFASSIMRSPGSIQQIVLCRA
jgi:hypothetical protein